MTKDEALKIALDALENTASRRASEQFVIEQHAISFIKQALAQHDSVQAKPEPEQEPVAKPYAYEYGQDNGDGTYSVVIEKGDLVQTAPAVYNYVRPRNTHKDWPVKELFDRPLPQRKPLTDGKISWLWSDAHNDTTDRMPFQVFARSIEAAHGIKE